MALSTILNALLLGLIFAIMALGLTISFKFLNIPDLSVDGTFTTGCALSIMFASNNHPFLGLLVGFLGGMIAGGITGFLQTKCKVQAILAGILTMSALYSINLKIMQGNPNVSLFGKKTFFSPFEAILGENSHLIIVLLIVIVLIFLLYLFFKTQIGLSIRATGDNEFMVKASSINADAMKIIGLALANGLVALSGAIFSQNQLFADVSGGVGIMVVGLASIIIGEAFIKNNRLFIKFIAIVFGAILYRFVLTLVLQQGIAASDLNLFSSILVALAISIPFLRKRRGHNAGY